MSKIIATLITLIALFTLNTPASAQGLFDVKLGGGKGGGGRVKVTLPQLVDGLLSQWEPHGFKRRYVDRTGGIVIGEMSWFPKAVRYRLGRSAIPPKDIIQFPPDKYMMPLALAVGHYNNPKTEAKAKAKVAQLIAKHVMGFKLNKVLLKKAKGKRRGKVEITDFEYTWKKDSKLSPEMVAQALNAREVKFAEQSWLLCQWAHAPKANESKANENFDPKKPMSCLIKVAFSFLNKKKKRKPVMAINLASLNEIPDSPAKIYLKDGKALKKPITVPGPVHFLMRQYGFKLKDALTFGKIYPATLNSPVLREGLIDPYRRIDDNGQPIVKTPEASSTSKVFTVLYWIAWFLIMIALGIALALFMNWLVKRFWSWNWTAKLVYVVLLGGVILLSLIWNWLIWGWLFLAVLLFALPSIIQRPPPAPHNANG